MAFSQQEKQIIEFAKANGKTKQETIDVLTKFRTSQPAQLVAQPESSAFSRIRDIPSDIAETAGGIKDVITSRGDKERDILEAKATGEQGFLSTAFQSATNFATTVTAVGAELAKGAVKLFTTPEQEEQTAVAMINVGNQLLDTPEAKQWLQNLSDLKDTNPEFARNVIATMEGGEFLLELIGLKVAKGGAELAIKGTKTALEGTEQAIRGGAKVVGETIAETGEVIGKKIGEVVKTGKSKIGKGKLGTPIEIAEDAITPSTKELTPKEFEKALRQGKITPKSTTKPSKFVLSKTEKAVAKKHQNLLQSGDPVVNSGNVIGEISSIDTQVGSFLKKFNTTIWSKKRLKQTLKDAIKPIDDITIPEARLVKAKNRMVDAFVDSIPKNATVEQLWIARKEFDRLIDFGSKALDQKMKRATRESIQEFISQLTNDTTYKAFMKDMRELFNILDTIETKATKEKGLSALKVWQKNNPELARGAKWIIGGGIVGSIVF